VVESTHSDSVQLTFLNNPMQPKEASGRPFGRRVLAWGHKSLWALVKSAVMHPHTWCTRMPAPGRSTGTFCIFPERNWDSNSEHPLGNYHPQIPPLPVSFACRLDSAGNNWKRHRLGIWICVVQNADESNFDFNCQDLNVSHSEPSPSDQFHFSGFES